MDLRSPVDDHNTDQRSRFFERVPSAVVVCDAAGALIDCNEQATTILGISRRLLYGRSPFAHDAEVLDEHGHRLHADALPPMDVLRTRVPSDGVEIARRTTRCGTRWLRLSSRLVDPFDPDSEVITSFWDVTDVRSRRRAFQTMRAAQDVILRATSVEQLLAQTCQTIVDAGDYALAWVAEAMPDRDRSVTILAAAGVTDYLLPDMISWHGGRPDGLGPVGSALRTGRPSLVDDVRRDRSFRPWSERASRHGFGSVIAVPFTDRRRRLALTVYASDPAAFDAATTEIFTSIAADIAYGVRHVDHVALLSGSLDATIDAIATMIEARDPYTAGHQHRVAELAAAVARDLGLDPVTVDELYLGALVHDIGKISLPAEILSKPARLDQAEFDLVKRHAAKGADILGHGRLPHTVVEIAEQHHERLDGSGYPHGLRGDEISYPARIVAVADVVEAIAHHRPYRPARGIDDAIAEIVDGSGTRYDSEVVASCLRVLDAGFEFSDGSG
jgi:putative nucleotidyltransferase with HDIG domain